MESAHYNLTLRQASESDSESLLEWRNDTMTRAFSINKENITRKQHKAWLNKALQDSGCLLLIGEINGRPVGMVRINTFDNSDLGQVSINLNPEFRSKGISRQLLGDSLKFGAQIFENISQYLATIHVDNAASKKIFEAIGFIKPPKSQSENFETYILDLKLLMISP